MVLKLNVSWHSGGLNSPTDVGGLSLSLTIIALVSRGNGFEPGPRCVNTFQFFPSFFLRQDFFLTSVQSERSILFGFRWNHF